ncbi:MAG: hypothetical protein M3O34_00500 [Chloroflexota bacterium]|nr:hypothetical protein [Chloroflexota bacterium]
MDGPVRQVERPQQAEAGAHGPGGRPLVGRGQPDDARQRAERGRLDDLLGCDDDLADPWLVRPRNTVGVVSERIGGPGGAGLGTVDLGRASRGVATGNAFDDDPVAGRKRQRASIRVAQAAVIPAGRGGGRPDAGDAHDE